MSNNALPPADDNDFEVGPTCTAEELAAQRYEAAKAKGDVMELSSDDSEDEMPVNTLRTRVCATCGKRSPTMRCPCLTRSYCSRDCLRANWRKHRPACPLPYPLKRFSGAVPSLWICYTCKQPNSEHNRKCAKCDHDSRRGGAAMRALQQPVSPTTELLNDVADDAGTPTYQPPSVMPPTSKSGAWCVNGAEAELEDGNICKIIKINAQKNMATVALKATQALTRSLPTSLLVRVKPKAGDRVRVVDGSAVYDAELLAIEDGDGIIQVDNGEYKIIDFSAIAKVADF